MEHLSNALAQAVPDKARTICRILDENGYRGWIVGGCVRDTVLNELEPGSRRVVDWDLCTDADPKTVSRLFKRVIATGIAHGTVTVLMGGESFEVTTLRGERGHSDGRHPDEVYFVHDLNEDLARRDFTVNAMAFDVLRGRLFDPFDGYGDLVAKKLRAVGDPKTRFAEDGLRVLRCARFCATLGFSIEETTRKAMFPSLSTFEKVAQERVRDEWFKALSAPEPSRFLEVIRREGMLSITAPPLATKDALARLDDDSLKNTIDRAPREPVLRLALLCVLLTQDAAQTARFLAKRLRLSKQQNVRLVELCAHAHLPGDLLERPSPIAARRFLHEVGLELLPDLKRLQTLAAQPENRSSIARVHAMLDGEAQKNPPLSTKDLAVNGKDLIEWAGIEKGPEVGHVLARLLEAVLQDPTLNEKHELLRLAQQKP